jgi:hypothetical protein
MLKDVETFIAVLTDAEAVWQRRGNEIRAARTSIGTGEYYDRHRANDSDQWAAQAAAWTTLVASTDKLVAFIGTNCSAYRDEAILVLRRLPATMDELQALSDEQDWCNTFDSFLEDAQEAGCFADAPAYGYTPAVAVLRRWFRDEVTSDVGLRRRLGELVAAVVAEATGIPLETEAPADQTVDA